MPSLNITSLTAPRNLIAAAGASTDRGNPNVANTAARHVANAMTRVHPRQREELLLETIAQAEACLRLIRSGRAA